MMILENGSRKTRDVYVHVGKNLNRGGERNMMHLAETRKGTS